MMSKSKIIEKKDEELKKRKKEKKISP